MKKKILLPILSLAILGGAILAWQHSREDKAVSTKLTLYGNVDIRQVQVAFKGS